MLGFFSVHTYLYLKIIQCKAPYLFYLSTKFHLFWWSHCWEIDKCITQPAFQIVIFASQISLNFRQWVKPIVFMLMILRNREYLDIFKWVNLEDKGW